MIIETFLQIDTFVNGQPKERAAAQIKTFCEKGADRKNKDEARRLSSQIPPYPCQVFYQLFKKTRSSSRNLL